MADIEIVIKIPEEVKQTFDNAKNEDLYGNYYDYNSLIGKAIKNGTLLPNNHGRLIDADSLIKAIEKKAKRLSNADTINGLCGAVALIFDEQTIIEGENEEE